MTAPDFGTSAGFAAALAALPAPLSGPREAARQRDAMLTKPPGALGRLEDLAIWYAGWKGDVPPRAAAQICIFAGNHGVAARGVSAFPPEVTAQMVANFQNGGAAINCLAELQGARLDVHPLELDRPTADFTQGPAMTAEELDAAMRAGWDAVDPGADLLVVGEMGIGNTTPAAALAAALAGGGAGGRAEDWTGAGTGVEGAALAAKARIVAEGLAAHAAHLSDPWEVLRRLGGRELAAMAGAILRARHARVPVLLDGYICTAAAAVLWRAAPEALDHAVAGHASAESAHRRLLEAMGKVPLLDLGLRLGEGSGAAVAIGVLNAALATHAGMASFDEAGVAGG